MKRLSRDNIEIIANRVFKAYKALPDIKNSECYRIEPEKLILEVLGLSIGIEHLSLSGDTLGLTTFREMGVEVYDEADEPFIYFLDGKTILVEKSLKDDITKRSCDGFFTFSTQKILYNFTGGATIVYTNSYAVANAYGRPVYRDTNDNIQIKDEDDGIYRYSR